MKKEIIRFKTIAYNAIGFLNTYTGFFTYENGVFVEDDKGTLMTLSFTDCVTVGKELTGLIAIK